MTDETLEFRTVLLTPSQETLKYPPLMCGDIEWALEQEANLN